VNVAHVVVVILGDLGTVKSRQRDVEQTSVRDCVHAVSASFEADLGNVESRRPGASNLGS
jgi:hypothetical protein